MSLIDIHQSNRAMIFTLATWLGSVLLALSSDLLAVEIPDDPSQSIVYWKPHIIAPEQNQQVADAQRIFNTLLRTWDGARIAPALHVVKSSSGPWAASLADGNILLSLDALQSCLSFGKDRAPHLLAFVLSHEIAHQRSDDLWHQKFFRLIGQQKAEQKKLLMRGLDNDWFRDIAEKEAQADHDAVLIMSSVGFDPFQIVDKKDFFTAWVEQIWRNSCGGISSSSQYYDACQQAKSRRMRTQAQLRTLSDQTVIYQLGLQAFVAGNYQQARQLFTAFGRELPSRAVYTSIALSYLAQAMTVPLSGDTAQTTLPELYFPLLLDTEPVDAVPGISAKRGTASVTDRYNRQQHIEQAIAYFEKAIKLNPMYRRSYLQLAMSYLLNRNTFMARGILQGQYQPRFGSDHSLTLLLALTDALEDKPSLARQQLQNLQLQLNNKSPLAEDAFPASLLRYACARNLILLDPNTSARDKSAIWKQLAQQANQLGDRNLFQLALQQLHPQQAKPLNMTEYPRISHSRPGDRFDKNVFVGGNLSEFWIEGDRHQIIRLENSGVKLVVDGNQKISNMWQSDISGQKLGRLQIGDKAERIQQLFGAADRELYFSSGIYLAYDRYGMGIHVLNGQVMGWFLYANAS